MSRWRRRRSSEGENAAVRAHGLPVYFLNLLQCASLFIFNPTAPSGQALNCWHHCNAITTSHRGIPRRRQELLVIGRLPFYCRNERLPLITNPKQTVCTRNYACKARWPPLLFMQGDSKISMYLASCIWHNAGNIITVQAMLRPDTAHVVRGRGGTVAASDIHARTRARCAEAAAVFDRRLLADYCTDYRTVFFKLVTVPRARAWSWQGR